MNAICRVKMEKKLFSSLSYIRPLLLGLIYLKPNKSVITMRDIEIISSQNKSRLMYIENAMGSYVIEMNRTLNRWDVSNMSDATLFTG